MIWMWEARAAPGRLDDLRRWAVDALGDREGEVYHSHQPAGDLVVLILRAPAPTPPPDPAREPGEVPLPTPPPDLLAGTPHAWPFRQVHPPR
jgi:hypothetical protein